MLDGSPQEFLRQFRAAAAQADERYRRIQQVQARTGQLRITERSPDGAVEITLDQQGKVVDLRFHDPARRLQPAALTTIAMNCLHSANSRLGAEVERIVREVSGENKTEAERLVERYRHDHPDQQPVAPQPVPRPVSPPVPVRRSPTPAELDPDEAGPIMRRGYQR